MSNIGTIELIATIDTSQYKQGVKNINQANRSVEGSIDDADKKTSSFGKRSAAVYGAIAGAAASLAYKGIGLITSSISGAIDRVDTLNNAPKVLQNLGFSAEGSAASIEKIANNLKGLPSRLNDVVSNELAVASATDYGIGKITDLTLAFNDMALAGGKGPEAAQQAFVQFTQALGKGKFQIQDFQTLMTVMPAQLKQVAQSLLGPKANAITLQKALGDGTITNNQFVNSIIRLDKKGGKGFASFNKQARDATQGIGTGMDNLGAAVQRGVAKVIDAIGSKKISAAISNIGKSFEVTLDDIALFIDFLNNHQSALFAFAGALTGIAVALGVAVAPAAWSAATAFGALVVSALPFIVIGAAIGLIAFTIIKNWEPIKKFFVNMFSSVIDWIKSHWKLILGILTGPIGLLVVYVATHIRQIKNGFNDLVSWFRSLPGRIGKAFSGAFDGLITAFKGAINWIIRAWNNLQFKIGGKHVSLPFGMGFTIPSVTLGTPNIPLLAQGGIVTSPTLAMIGEGGEDEAVIPLSKLDKILANERNNTTNNNAQNITINVSGTFVTSPAEQRRVAQVIADKLQEINRSKAGGMQSAI